MLKRALCLALALLCPAGTWAQETELVSRAAFPTIVQREGFGQTVSADGRWVVFTSSARDIAPGIVDSLREPDVFLHDRQAGTTVLVSHSTAASNITANQRSLQPAISADGEYVAFLSDATDLVSGVTDTLGTPDLFLYRRTTGAITLVSRSAAGARTANGSTLSLKLSDDASLVAFESYATDLVTGQIDTVGTVDVFLFDRTAGTTTLLSHASPNNRTGNGPTFLSSISASGDQVALATYATDFGTGATDGNGESDVVLYTKSTGSFTLVSHTSSPLQAANRGSGGGILDASGGWLIFTSAASDLGTGGTDTNSRSDVFLYERATGALTLVSRAFDGLAAVGRESSGLGISRDGRWAVFSSQAPNLVAGFSDGNGDSGSDLYLFDRTTGAVSLISRAGSPVVGGNGSSDYASLSADGKGIAFTSQARNLVPGMVDQNQGDDVFRFDRESAATSLVSHAAGAETTAGNARAVGIPVVSSDGSIVTFVSLATDLVAGVAPLSVEGLFVHQTASGSTRLLTQANLAGSASANGRSSRPVASEDGRYVAFSSPATNLVAGQTDANMDDDVFLTDRLTGQTVLVSHGTTPTATGNGWAGYPRISADGAYVVFASTATDLVEGVADGNGQIDVFLYERATGTLAVVSHSISGRTGNHQSFEHVVSGDGRYVAFASLASDLVAGMTDTSGFDVYLYDRVSRGITLVSHTAASLLASAGPSKAPIISADGAYIAFESTGTQLVPGVSDTNATKDVFLFERTSGAIQLVSHGSTLDQTANGPSLCDGATIDAAGRFVAFRSYATVLGTFWSDANLGADVFLFDRVTGAISLVSHTADPDRTVNGESWRPSIAADGGYVLFETNASDVGAGITDSNGTYDVFLFERASGAIRVVSHHHADPLRTANSSSFFRSVTANGGYVAFVSTATDLVEGLGGAPGNLFLQETLSGRSRLVTHRANDPQRPAEPPLDDEGDAVASASGPSVVFLSPGSDLLAAPDLNEATDVFARSFGPAVSVTGAGLAEGNSGSVDATFSVSLAEPARVPITVSYSTADGTARAAEDYVAAVGSLTFALGVTQLAVRVAVVGDTLDEPDESFYLDIANPLGTVGVDRAEGLIQDDDPPPSLTIADVAVAEANSAVEAVFTVRLDRASGREITVSYATHDDTARAAAQEEAPARSPDMSPWPGPAVAPELRRGAPVTTVATPTLRAGALVVHPSGLFVYGAHPTRPRISGWVVQPRTGEAEPLASMPLVRPPLVLRIETGGRYLFVGDAAGIRVFAIDPRHGSLQAVADAEVSEGVLDLASVEGRLYAVSHAGLVAYDVDPVSGALVRIGASERAGRYSHLQPLPGGSLVVLGGGRLAALTIDPWSARSQTLWQATVPLEKGREALTGAGGRLYLANGAGVHGITVGDAEASSIAPPSAGREPLAIAATAEGNALFVVDAYRGLATYRIDETGRMWKRSSAGGRFSALAVDPAGRGTYALRETAGGPVLMRADERGATVQLAPDVPADVGTAPDSPSRPGPRNVEWPRSTAAPPSDLSSAAGPGDYTPVAGILTFPAGTTVRTLAVPVLGDPLDEDDETFIIDLTNAVNAVVTGGRATGTILDDDPQPVLDIADAIVTEGRPATTMATFLVTLSRASGRIATVAFATGSESATSPADYGSSTGVLTFTPGTTSGVVAIPVVDDTLAESTESFVVTLMNPVNGIVGDGLGRGTIIDDEAGASLVLADTNIPVGANLAFTLAGGPGHPQDWVGLYRMGDGNLSYREWEYLNGLHSPPPAGVTAASLSFRAPLEAGTYEVRLFAANGYSFLARSAPVEVKAPGLTASATSAAPGQPVQFTFANGPGGRLDWLGLYAESQPNSAYVAWAYTNGLTAPPATGSPSGTVTLRMPPTPGSYRARYLVDNGFTAVAQSAVVQVDLAALGATVSASAASGSAGQPISAIVAGGTGHPHDWVGLYPVGTPDTQYLDWRYLNGTQSPPATGLSTASVGFTLPAAAGAYEFRLFYAGGYSRLAASGPVTVAPPSVSVASTIVAAGATVVVTIEGGPGNRLDWVGLYERSAPSAAYLAWVYLSGTQTPPPAGLSNVSLLVTMPMQPGVYEFRLFRDNGSQGLATSPSVTVN